MSTIYEQFETKQKALVTLDGVLTKDSDNKKDWVDAIILANEEKLEPLLRANVVIDGLDEKDKEALSEHAVQLDSVEEGKSVNAIVPFREILLDAINTEGVTPTEIYAIVDNGLRLSENFDIKATLDGVNELVGTEIVRQVIVSNANLIKNSSLGGIIGNISNFKPSTNGMGTSYMIFTHNHIVTDGKGDLKTNTIIDSRNVFTNASTLRRKAIIKKKKGQLEYEFNAKLAKDDSKNYPIKVGKTSVDFGLTGVTLDDQGADQHDTSYTTDKSVKGKGKVTIEIDYAKGKVKIKLENDEVLPDGAIMSLISQLNDDKLEETRTLLGEKFTPYVYIPSPVDIGTKIRIDREREIIRNIGKSLLPSGMQSSMQIIKAGQLQEAVQWITGYADIFEAISLEMNLSLGTINEYYKIILDAISRSSTELLRRTNIEGANNISIIGGSGLEKIFNLAHSGIDTHTDKGNIRQNGIRKIGLLNGTYPSYYYPLYDEENPKTDENGVITGDKDKDVYSSITIVGMPYDETKAIVIKGITDPIRPNKVKLNANNEITVFLYGQTILAPNKSAKSKQLSTKILFKV